MSRVLLKLSGESFSNPETNFGIEPKVIERIASEITAANNENIQIGVVVGGGNFFRGVQESAKNMAQANADYMGMLATVINAVALKGLIAVLINAMFNSPFGLNYFRTLYTCRYKLYVYCVDMVLHFGEDNHFSCKSCLFELVIRITCGDEKH